MNQAQEAWYSLSNPHPLGQFWPNEASTQAQEAQIGGSLYISHRSALEYWRTNPPWYVLEGRDRNIRSLRDCMRMAADFLAANVPESEFGEPPFDILIPASNPPRCPDRFRPHKQSCQLPRHALYPLWDGVYVVSPERSRTRVRL